MKSQAQFFLSQQFQEAYSRPPDVGDLFEWEGDLYHNRGGMQPWVCLGKVDNLPEGVEGCSLELYPGIVVRGDQSRVLELVFQGRYGMDVKDTKDLVPFLFNLFRECGWKLPFEDKAEEDSPLPGTVKIILPPPELYQEYHCPDLRNMLRQLNDEGFTGWLRFQSVNESGSPFLVALNGDKYQKIHIFLDEQETKDECPTTASDQKALSPTGTSPTSTLENSSESPSEET